MRPQAFNRWWLSVFLGLCLLQVLIAVISDTYCVFGIVRFPKRNFEPNTRFLKVEYLRRQPQYNAFILGSSRASFLESASARTACGSEHRYFNLSASLENGAGIRQKLEWLTRTRAVSQVIIAIDFDLQSVLGDPLDLLRQDHPLISGASNLGFYAKYLLFQPRILWIFLQGHWRATSSAPWERGNRGLDPPLYATAPLLDGARLFATTLGAAAADLKGRREHRLPATGDGSEEFRRTIGILERTGTHRILIVPPYRLDQYASFSIDAYTEWMGKIVADAGEIWDFSGYNAVTQDAGNYDDPLHFNEVIGDRILRRACGASGSDVVEHFGTRVTAENIAAHLAAHRTQYASARTAIAGGLLGPTNSKGQP